MIIKKKTINICVSKLDNLDEMVQFLEKQNLTKYTQEVDNLSKAPSSKETEAIIK